jgi:hypothetical protein
VSCYTNCGREEDRRDEARALFARMLMMAVLEQSVSYVL